MIYYYYSKERNNFKGDLLMERILNAIETIESGATRKFGFEDDKTKLVFSLTEFLREIFAEEKVEEEKEEFEVIIENGVIVFNEDELTFADIVEMFNEGVNVAEILDECEDETILRIVREEILREMCE
jgi:hypothetical protein